ncbi:hypothetical protein IKM56_00320 [Candidatus Saccharibacteria bacterium]|nr:hypothetical protein [Candidatus Saccharibacteria bacterium]
MAIILGILAFLVLFFGLFAFTGAPYVSSKKRDLDDLFKNLYPLKESDFVIDLGSGDGAVLKTVSEHHAKGLGVELNPFLVLISRIRLRKDKNIRFVCENLYRVEFPKETTCIYLFGDDRDFDKIENKIQQEANRLKKKLVLLSYGFDSKNHKATKAHGAYYLYEIKPEK